MIVAIKERSAGNAEVGDMWQETKIFSEVEPVGNVYEWGRKQQSFGRLILTKPQNTNTKDDSKNSPASPVQQTQLSIPLFASKVGQWAGDHLMSQDCMNLIDYMAKVAEQQAGA